MGIKFDGEFSVAAAPQVVYDLLSDPQKFAPLLHGDGLLFVGHSENLHHSADLFRSCQKTVYRLNEKGKAMHG